MNPHSIELQHQLTNALRETIPDCQAIYSFGSWGSDAERSDSDIDLAVLPLIPLDPVQRWELAQQHLESEANGRETKPCFEGWPTWCWSEKF